MWRNDHAQKYFVGRKQVTSSGCNSWEVWEGMDTHKIFLSRSFCRTVGTIVCDPYPSTTKIRHLPSLGIPSFDSSKRKSIYASKASSVKYPREVEMHFVPGNNKTSISPKEQYFVLYRWPFPSMHTAAEKWLRSDEPWWCALGWRLNFLHLITTRCVLEQLLKSNPIN